LFNLQSLNICSAIYNTNWYDLPPKEAKMLVVIMRVTQSPLEITAGKFAALSLDYFMKVCLIKTKQNKKQMNNQPRLLHGKLLH